MVNPLLDFLQALWAGGDLILSSSSKPSDTDVAISLSELQVLEIEYRRSIPGRPPVLNLSAAGWALTQLYRACQYVVYRELPDDQIQTELSRKCPEVNTSTVCYSVDLSFRFLPDVMRLARVSAPNSPLLTCLSEWASDWPLSSVGMRDVNVVAIDPILVHPSLKTLYVDRILATDDRPRLSDFRVAEAVRVALGGFRELSPAIYDIVHQPQSAPATAQRTTVPDEPVVG